MFKSLLRKIGRKIIALVLIQISLRIRGQWDIYTREQVWNALDTKYPGLGSQENFKRLYCAGLYRCCSVRLFERILRWDWTSSREWHRYWLNCTWFAPALMGRIQTIFGLNNVGMVYDEGSAHAYNVVVLVGVDGYPDIRLLEPQNDRWIEPGVQPYTMQRGVIIL